MKSLAENAVLLAIVMLLFARKTVQAETEPIQAENISSGSRHQEKSTRVCCGINGELSLVLMIAIFAAFMFVVFLLLAAPPLLLCLISHRRRQRSAMALAEELEEVKRQATEQTSLRLNVGEGERQLTENKQSPGLLTDDEDQSPLSGQIHDDLPDEEASAAVVRSHVVEPDSASADDDYDYDDDDDDDDGGYVEDEYNYNSTAISEKTKK